MKNLRYYSNSWFICLVCPSVCGWKAINSFISIPNILFNSFVNSAANYGSLSSTTLSGNLCNFHTLFLNNLANPFTNVPSVVATKYIILNNLLQTTSITSFPATNSNFVIKSTIRWVQGFSVILLKFNFPTRASVWFFIFWHISHSSTYCLTSLITSGHQ